MASVLGRLSHGHSLAFYVLPATLAVAGLALARKLRHILVTHRDSSFPDFVASYAEKLHCGMKPEESRLIRKLARGYLKQNRTPFEDELQSHE